MNIDELGNIFRVWTPKADHTQELREAPGEQPWVDLASAGNGVTVLSGNAHSVVATFLNLLVTSYNLP